MNSHNMVHKGIILTLTLFLLLLFGLFSCKEAPKEEYSPPVQNLNLKPINIENDIRLLKDAVSEDPKNLNAWIKLGNLLMDNKRFTEAIEAYSRALELDPKNTNVRVDMGTCYRYSGNPNRAVEEYKKALQVDPNHLYAHKNLGVVLAYDLNRLKEAIQEFKTYLSLSPDAPDAAEVKKVIQDLTQRL